MASEKILEEVKAKILARRAIFEDQRVPFESVGKNAAKGYLAKLVKLTTKLRDHLHNMPLEVRETGALFPEPEDFGVELANKLVWPAVATLKIIERKPGRKGNRENRKAHHATWLIATTYEEVAGVPPTLEEERSLVDELLPALGIKADAEHCVRARRREMKKETMHIK